MKVILDTCISPITKLKLEEGGYDVIWTGDWQTDPGDEEILKFAYREKRILITLDLAGRWRSWGLEC